MLLLGDWKRCGLQQVIQLRWRVAACTAGSSVSGWFAGSRSTRHAGCATDLTQVHGRRVMHTRYVLQSVSLADMMVECLARPEQSVADAALEYFTCLDYVAMADRAPPLRVGLLSALWIGIQAAVLKAAMLHRSSSRGWRDCHKQQALFYRVIAPRETMHQSTSTGTNVRQAAAAADKACCVPRGLHDMG